MQQSLMELNKTYVCLSIQSPANLYHNMKCKFSIQHSTSIHVHVQCTPLDVRGSCMHAEHAEYFGLTVNHFTRIIVFLMVSQNQDTDCDSLSISLC